MALRGPSKEPSKTQYVHMIFQSIQKRQSSHESLSRFSLGLLAAYKSLIVTEPYDDVLHCVPADIKPHREASHGPPFRV